MLKLKYLFENYDQAKEILENYDHMEEGLDELLQHFRISSNAIYPFRDSKGNVCFLRYSPVEEKTIDEVISEIHIINWLIRKGYPAMQPVPMKDGSLAKQISTKWGTVNVSCFRKVAGKTLERTEGDLNIAFGYGTLLGNLHKLLMDYPRSNERLDTDEVCERVAMRLKANNAPDAVMKEYESVVAELRKLDRNNENYGIVHYDFEADNVLFDPESNSFGVIDFDDAIRCWFALDIVRALDCMDDIVEEALVTEACEQFLEGYKSVKNLAEEQVNSFDLMRRLVKLESYATIMHVLSEPIENEPDWMIECKEKLNNTLIQIENSLE